MLAAEQRPHPGIACGVGYGEGGWSQVGGLMLFEKLMQ